MDEKDFVVIIAILLIIIALLCLFMGGIFSSIIMTLLCYFSIGYIFMSGPYNAITWLFDILEIDLSKFKFWNRKN